VLRPTCHPNQLPSIHRFSFPHRWSTLPLHQGPGEKKTEALFIFGSLALKSKIDVRVFPFLLPQGVQPPLRDQPQSLPLHGKKGVVNEPLTESLFSKSGLERFWDNRGDMLLARWIGFLEKRSVKKFSKKKKHSLVWGVGGMKPPSFVGFTVHITGIEFTSEFKPPFASKKSRKKYPQPRSLLVLNSLSLLVKLIRRFRAAPP